MKYSKSQKAIISTYKTLKETKPIEKITVTSLCKIAQVNKSTFYVYYKDIYDLADKVEDEIVSNITNSINHLEYVFDRTDLFTEEVFNAYNNNINLIQTIFSGSRSDSLPRKVHQSLTKLLFKLKPEYVNSPEKHIMLSYMVYGSYYAFLENKHLDFNYVVSVIGSLTKI